MKISATTSRRVVFDLRPVAAACAVLLLAGGDVALAQQAEQQVTVTGIRRAVESERTEVHLKRSHHAYRFHVEQPVQRHRIAVPRKLARFDIPAQHRHGRTADEVDCALENVRPGTGVGDRKDSATRLSANQHSPRVHVRTAP